jgi:hypothetical protein
MKNSKAFQTFSLQKEDLRQTVKTMKNSKAFQTCSLQKEDLWQTVKTQPLLDQNKKPKKNKNKTRVSQKPENQKTK